MREKSCIRKVIVDWCVRSIDLLLVVKNDEVGVVEEFASSRIVPAGVYREKLVYLFAPFKIYVVSLIDLHQVILQQKCCQRVHQRMNGLIRIVLLNVLA